MQDKEKFHIIFEKIKKTFENLRGMLPEIPSEPTGTMPGKVQIGQTDQDTQVVFDQTGCITDSKGEVELFGTIPDFKITLFSQDHRFYLENIIATYEYMLLPGFYTNNQPLKVPFEKAFVPPLFLDKHIGMNHPERDNSFNGGTGELSVSSALQRYRRLVITGSPGSGKTSLLVSLLLTYTRSLLGERSEGLSSQTDRDAIRLLPFRRQRLHAVEYDYLPVFLSIRELGKFLQEWYPRSGKDAPNRLLNYLRLSPPGLSGSLPALPEKFFNLHLVSGKALILLDGLDEVENPVLRQRVVTLIEKFINRYPACRYIVTSRSLDCGTPPFLGEQFGTLQINEFSPLTAREFARSWSRMLENSLAGCETPEALDLAKQRADELIKAMDGNQRIAELATSPLTLVLLALIQRFGKQFPERKSDLYETALGVLLEHGREADRSGKNKLGRFEKQRALEMIAFWMHQHNKCELSRADLIAISQARFAKLGSRDETLGANGVDATTFLEFILDQDNGLFVEQAPGVYGFVHRTFQEVLAAQALADREDTLAYTLRCVSVPWWRGVILFEAGILGRQAKHRVSELIRLILNAGTQTGVQPHSSTFLAAECLLNLDPKHLEVGLLIDVKNSLRKLASVPILNADHQGLMDKVMASNILVSLQGGQALARFWKLKYGEPEWVRIPAGEFWMGETSPDGDKFAHQVFLPEYQISRVTVTNAQYALYLKDSGVQPPVYWHNGQVPRGRDNHPVVNVNWHEALAYSAWLGKKINQPVSLPSEAEWEKAARGVQDQREYPWGNWDELRANTSDLVFGDTTPVGLFTNGASPFGLLDMSGNVREWTRSLFGFGYPYDPTDKARENLQALNDQPRVLRGGSFSCARDSARCAHRQRYYPEFGFNNFGFRVVISPAFSQIIDALPPQ